MSKRFPRIGWIIMVGLLCLSLAILPACGNGNGGGPIPLLNPGDFVQELFGDIASLDPAWAYDTSSGEQIGYIYEPLLFFNRSSTDVFEPILAQNFTVVNATTIRFFIRAGVQFSNNNSLTPSDVEYSLERVMIQDRVGGPSGLLLNPLAGVPSTRNVNGTLLPGIYDLIKNSVEVDGDYVVIYQNSTAAIPSVTLLQILCGTWASIVDKEWCIANGDWNGTEPGWTAYNNPAKSASYLYEHAMGTGPWKLLLWSKTTEIKLVKNTNYWKGSVPFNNVITKWTQEYSSRKLSLLAGTADFIDVPPEYYSELDPVADLNIYSDLGQLVNGCMFFNFNISASSGWIGSGQLNGQGIPPGFFNDTNVRKAFAYCMDYDAVIDDLYAGNAIRIPTPMITGLSGFNPDAAKYLLNLTIAKTLLETSGWGNLTAIGFKCTIFYNTGNLVRQGACDILASNLQMISTNFLVSVQGMMWSTYQDQVFTLPNSVIPMFAMGWGADYPDQDNFCYPFMHTSGDFSQVMHYGKPAWDTLIMTARLSSNATERTEIYYQLQQEYYDDPGGIPYAQPTGKRHFTKYIHNFFWNPMFPGQAGPLYYMSKS